MVQTCESLAEESIKTEESIEHRKAQLKDSDIDQLHKQLRKLETIYSFLEKSGRHPEGDLQRVRRKIDQTRRRLKDQS